MKQRFYNWIYRTLGKFGIKSTQYINMHDAFSKVKALSPNDSHNCSVSVHFLWYPHRGDYEYYWSITDNQRAYSGDSFTQAFGQYEAAQKTDFESDEHIEA